MKIIFSTKNKSKEVDLGKVKTGTKAVGNGLKSAAISGLTAVLAGLNKSSGNALESVKPEGYDEKQAIEQEKDEKIASLKKQLKAAKAGH